MKWSASGFFGGVGAALALVVLGVVLLGGGAMLGMMGQCGTMMETVDIAPETGRAP